VLLTAEAFAQHHQDAQLHVAGDGEEAMRFVRRTGDFASAPRPTLVLLDLNLPRRSGLEVRRSGASMSWGIYVKGALRSGVTVAEIQEVLIHAIAYCGTPAGHQAFLAAHRTLSQEGALG
jgi:hypothetical protein